MASCSSRIGVSEIVPVEAVMRTVRENTALRLAAVFSSNRFFKPIAEALYALSVRRALRSIERYG